MRSAREARTRVNCYHPRTHRPWEHSSGPAHVVSTGWTEEAEADSIHQEKKEGC